MYKLKQVSSQLSINSETKPVYSNGAWNTDNGVISDPTGENFELILPPRTWVVDDIRSGLTLSERVKWDNDLLPEIKTAKIELSAPQEIAHTTEVLQLLVSVSAISQASMDKVLS